MKTSSIGLAAAAVLTLASIQPAAAGGWIGGGRPAFFPHMHMVAPPMFPTARRFGPIGQLDFHHGFNRAAGFFPFGAGPLVVGAPAYVPTPGPVPSYAVGSLGGPVILTPINVTIVGPRPRCFDGDSAFVTGGPRIIEIGPQPSSSGSAKMPTVIYGSHMRRSC